MSDSVFPGEELRDRREELNYSLDDIHCALHIPTDYLRALESGSVASLPSETYCLGFVKTYSAYLGLDANRYVDAYRACLDQPSPTFRRRGALPGDRPKWASEFKAWAAVCAVLLLLWVTYAVVVGPSAEDPRGAVEAGTKELVLPDVPARTDFSDF